MTSKDINIHETEALFRKILITNNYQIEDHEKAPAALPDSSLHFLLNVCKEFKVTSVFEFGSGRSTKAFLSNGFNVTSLEDSEHWLNETIKDLTDEEKQKHLAFVRPLDTQLLGAFPVLDWKLDKELIQALKKADLVLIDSPYYTPFRESSLLTALQYAYKSVIVLDDTRIPTLNKFCKRLADNNPTLFHFKANVGHGFDVFIKTDDTKKMRLGHSVTDTLKGWLRYFMGLKFYRQLKN